MSDDPLEYTDSWRVRQYEVDANGHVNNAVYLNYAEEMAARHAESSGFGAAWAAAHGGGWVIRRNEVDYHLPARYGDELTLTVRVEVVKGTRGQRRTTIRRASDRQLLAEVFTEWVWVRSGDGRPAAVPAELVQVAAAATQATLRRRSIHRSR
ncbi:MAG: acyl-CoA thioesterase [Candidatus Dormibacteria bacterium]